MHTVAEYVLHSPLPSETIWDHALPWALFLWLSAQEWSAITEILLPEPSLTSIGCWWTRKGTTLARHRARSELRRSACYYIILLYLSKVVAFVEQYVAIYHSIPKNGSMFSDVFEFPARIDLPMLLHLDAFRTQFVHLLTLESVCQENARLLGCRWSAAQRTASKLGWSEGILEPCESQSAAGVAFVTL